MSRLYAPLGAAGVLLIASLATLLWRPRPVPPPAEEAPRDTPAAVQAPAPAVASPAPTPAPRPDAPAPVATTVVTPEGTATVVPLQPGDTVPDPERPDAPPQENDAIEPEKLQTAAWKLEKTRRISTLLGRDVERLERDRERAESQGSPEEARRLATLIQRHRQHLEKLRADMDALAEAARHEPPEP
ncbi:hypothetical protein P2318_32670 [Myxococcaceae bacterium GXIMD 01537]